MDRSKTRNALTKAFTDLSGDPAKNLDDNIRAYNKETRSIYESAVKRPQIDIDNATYIAESIDKIRSSNGALLGPYTTEVALVGAPPMDSQDVWQGGPSFLQKMNQQSME